MSTTVSPLCVCSSSACACVAESCPPRFVCVVVVVALIMLPVVTWTGKIKFGSKPDQKAAASENPSVDRLYVYPIIIHLFITMYRTACARCRPKRSLRSSIDDSFSGVSWRWSISAINITDMVHVRFHYAISAHWFNWCAAPYNLHYALIQLRNN